MAGEWQETTWGEIATLEYGKSLRGYGDVPAHARVFGTNGPIGWHTESLWNGPGVIVGRKGAYRGVHYTEQPYWVIDTAYTLRPREELNLRWAYYQLQTVDLDNVNDGSPIPSTTRPAFYALPVLKPPLEEQNRIANLLGTIDDKIALSKQLIETVQAIILTMFKSWFVSFDPVRAKAEGRSTGLSEKLANCFPAEFSDDALPLGWRMGCFADNFEVRGGNTPRTDNPAFWNGEHQWATPKDLSKLQTPVLMQTARQLTDEGLALSNSGLLPPGSLLLSTRAPIGYMAFTSRPTAINQGFAGIVGKNGGNAFAWAWCQTNLNLIEANAGGSTFPEISKSTLRSLPMLEPGAEALAEFKKVADLLLQRIFLVSEEIQTLEALRAALLPKLISGELQTNQVKKISVA